jgi:hypothetical protein
MRSNPRDAMNEARSFANRKRSARSVSVVERSELKNGSCCLSDARSANQTVVSPCGKRVVALLAAIMSEEELRFRGGTAI